MSVIAFDIEEFKSLAYWSSLRSNKDYESYISKGVYRLYVLNHQNFNMRYRHPVKDNGILSYDAFLKLPSRAAMYTPSKLISMISLLEYNTCDYVEYTLEDYKILNKVNSRLFHFIDDEMQDLNTSNKTYKDKLERVLKLFHAPSSKEIKDLILKNTGVTVDVIKCKSDFSYNIHYTSTLDGDEWSKLREFINNYNGILRLELKQRH